MEKSNLLANLTATKGISRVPIVELAGYNRVLIENHLGVLAYSLEEIQVKVTYGKLCVFGSGLKLLQLTREQLVINGQIDAVKLYRG